MKFLMVCLGNICRSPIAHGLLQHKARAKGLSWEVDSAGTSNWHEGELPNIKSIEIMDKHGVDIRYQRSRPIQKSDLDYYDVVYVMDHSNYKDVIDMAGNDTQRSKVRMILNDLYPGSDEIVPDPYGMGIEKYQEVYDMLDAATDAIIEKWSSQ